MLAYQPFSSKDFRKYIKKYLGRFPLLKDTEMHHNSKGEWRVWVDVETDIVIAISSINTLKENCDYNELEFLEVSYGWRGKGIGSYILEEIKKEFKKIVVFPLYEAVEFYERYGFKRQYENDISFYLTYDRN